MSNIKRSRSTKRRGKTWKSSIIAINKLNKLNNMSLYYI